MFKLERSKEFEEEYQSFKDKIISIDNVQAKEELFALLNALLNEVKKIDIQHNEVIISHRISSATVETRNNIIKLRQRINEKIEESKNLI
jgi:recombinational DNA repair protein RecR